MTYRDKQERKLCLLLNKKKYFFSQDRLLRLSGLCQVYLEEYPQTEEIELLDPTFDGDNLCFFFQFLDTLDLPLGKEECLGLYHAAVYFCLVEKYTKLLRDAMATYFLDKLELVITFDDHGSYICREILTQLEGVIRAAFGLPPQGIQCNPGSQGQPGVQSDEAKKEKKDRKQARRAERRANRKK